VNLVTRGHFRSRDKDGGHTIRSVIAEKLYATRKHHASMFYRTEVIAVLPIEVLHCGVGIFDLFAPVTLILTQ